VLLSDRLLEKKWTYRRSSSERDLTPASEDNTNDPPPPPLPTTPIPNVVVASADFSGNNRLSRIFSVRRSGDSSPAASGVPESTNAGPGMHPLPEEEEAMLGGGVGGVAPAVPPPTLPPLPPPLMSPEQTKRRYIVNSLVQSENNYLGNESGIGIIKAFVCQTPSCDNFLHYIFPSFDSSAQLWS
jgi:hypothetical protein